MQLSRRTVPGDVPLIAPEAMFCKFTSHLSPPSPRTSEIPEASADADVLLHAIRAVSNLGTKQLLMPPCAAAVFCKVADRATYVDHKFAEESYTAQMATRINGEASMRVNIESKTANYNLRPLRPPFLLVESVGIGVTSSAGHTQSSQRT